MNPVMKICLFIMDGAFIFVMAFALIKGLILSKYKICLFQM